MENKMLYKAKDRVTEDYDVIVVGSGLAGMTAANKMAKDGMKVLLLEAHNKLGGFATWFFRQNKDHVFDVSLHGFPFGMKKTCRKYWNKNIADHIVQLKDVRFINPEYNIQSSFTREDFTDKLVNNFKVDIETVNSFYNYIESMNFYDNKHMTNRDLFQKFFPDRNDITRFLMEPIVYANGSTLDDPAISYGIVFSNFMSKGVYTFKGGTDVIIKMMREELLSNNVDIKMHSKIEKIVIEGGITKGVMLKDDFIKSKAVLSNANIRSTIINMAGAENFSESFIKKTKDIRMNSSSCQVYMGIRPGETIPHIGDLVFTSTHPTFDSEALLDMNITSRTFSVYYPEGRPYDENPRYCIVSSTNANYSDWNDLAEEEYKAEKEKMIEETLVCLEKYIPDIRNKIDFVDAATPRTVKKFVHHESGTSFGTKFEGLDVSMNLHKEVDGLFHAGSVGIIMSGWLGAANYGVIQSNEIASYLYKLDKDEQIKTESNSKNDQGAIHV
jgi:phytoene dehydrogenase-like protein